jgi:hypothetical protein
VVPREDFRAQFVDFTANTSDDNPEAKFVALGR